MGNVADWVLVVINAMLLGGLVIAWMQMRKDHERSRREKAIDLIFAWVTNVDRRGTAARKLGETLTFDQAKALFQHQPFSIDVKHGGLVEAVFDTLPPTSPGNFQIDEKLCAEFRWLLLSYLNNLEAVFASWRHNVADRGIISEQFSFLVSAPDNHYILENYRKAADGDKNYPAIAEFVRHMKVKRETGGAPPIV